MSHDAQDDDVLSIITVERIHELHALALSSHGQADLAPPRAGCVEGALGNAFLGARFEAGEGEGVDILRVAGRLLYYLVQNHCYIDGNKRIGWLAAVELLRVVGIEVDVGVNEAYDFVTEIAKGTEGTLSAHDAIDWLAERLVELPDDVDLPPAT